MGQQYRGVPLARRRAERRDRLLDSALELFYRRGYPASPVSDICRHAGVSTRHFYEIFPDREALLGALYDAAHDASRTAVLAAVADADEGSGFAGLIDRAVGAYAKEVTRDRRIAHLLTVSVYVNLIEDHLTGWFGPRGRLG